MRYAGLRIPFATRMTIVRLPDGALWLHSPTPPEPALRAAIDALGPVRFLISPNRLHTSWIEPWARAYPAVQTAYVGGRPPWSGDALPFQIDLSAPGPFPWSPAIAQVLVPGDLFSETVFFHTPSRTLIVTDLIENFERHRVRRWWLRALLALTGPLDPNGTAPPDMRLTFRRHRPALRAAITSMLAWHPQRIILAHGRWYPENGEQELRRAFAWALS